MIAALSRMVEFLSVTELTEKYWKCPSTGSNKTRTIESRSRLENIDEFCRLRKSSRRTTRINRSSLPHGSCADRGHRFDERWRRRSWRCCRAHDHAQRQRPGVPVFIIGMEVFSRAFMDNEELEEERRLAYVGITRAEKRCSSCACGPFWPHDGEHAIAIPGSRKSWRKTPRWRMTDTAAAAQCGRILRRSRLRRRRRRTLAAAARDSPSADRPLPRKRAEAGWRWQLVVIPSGALRAVGNLKPATKWPMANGELVRS